MEYISSPWVISWMVLGVCILALAVYRKLLANREDDIVHVTSGESKVFSKQLIIAQRLQKIDFWGKTMTIVLAVYGLALVGLLVYRQYNGYYTPQ